MIYCTFFSGNSENAAEVPQRRNAEPETDGSMGTMRFYSDILIANSTLPGVFPNHDLITE